MDTPDIIKPIKPVNRQEQVEEFRLALGRIRDLGSAHQPLFEWHGGPGIGKSMLIKLLIQECEKSRIPYSFVDFSRDRNLRAGRYADDLSLLVEDLLSGFDKDETSDVRDAIEQYRDAEYRKLDGAAKEFQTFINKRTTKEPVVLFFDGTEGADQDTVVAWLEEWIVAPLVRNRRCLIVWCGRRPQRWKHFDVRRSVRVEELGVFDEEGTESLFKKNSRYSLEELAIPARKLTGGHPFADTIVLRYLDFMARDGRKPRKEHFDEVESNLLDILIQNFVDEFAFRGLDADVVSACRIMSLVRQFDIIMLREILTQAVPGTFARFGRNDFSGLLARMRATPLVLWDDRRKGYALDSTLRHIIGEHIRRHSLELYTKINRFAIIMYQDWIRRAGDNRGIYIVEELYQQSCINSVLNGPASEGYRDLKDLLKQRIDDYHQSDADLRASALDRLYHELENDPDLTLIIGSNQKTTLLDMVRDERTNVYTAS